jgi:hypothetical protein
MLLDKPKNWTKWLPLAQFWYNSNFHTALKTTPFQALYGYPQPQPSLGHPPKSTIEAVDSLLHQRHRAMTQLKSNLLQAQQRMKKFADQHRTERSFGTGDWVYLKLQPYRQLSISGKQNQKLSPRFYGPFEIEQRIGKVAYRLRFPVGSAIHLILYVSQLKKHISRGTNISPTLPIATPEGQLKIYPLQILAQCTVKRHNVVAPQLLIKWSNLADEDVSWEDYDILARHYPSFIF